MTLSSIPIPQAPRVPSHPIPTPSAETGRRALQAMIQERSILPALSVFHHELGDVFRISAGAFQSVMLAGPEACRFVLVTARDQLSWRPEGDPVTRLLRHGVLVEDGEAHDALRQAINPALHRRMLEKYVEGMWQAVDAIAEHWTADSPIDVLKEMRRIALLVVMDELYDADFAGDLERLLPSIIRAIQYISPGLWTIWPSVPRPGYEERLRILDDYLYKLIARRRDQPGGSGVLSLLIEAGLDDDLIRDQLLTLLIAGHDTSTTLLAWALYLMGRHPDVMARARLEVDAFLGPELPTLQSVQNLHYLDRVIQETMRLYPPIHIGNRRALTDLDFQGYHIPAGTRVAYSIYLTHRDPAHWPNPGKFIPDHFLPEAAAGRAPYTFLPFGGGPRNCIGRAFAEVEAKVVLGRLLQHFDFTLLSENVHAHMGATLEPRPGIIMRAHRREENYR